MKTLTLHFENHIAKEFKIFLKSRRFNNKRVYFSEGIGDGKNNEQQFLVFSSGHIHLKDAMTTIEISSNDAQVIWEMSQAWDDYSKENNLF